MIVACIGNDNFKWRTRTTRRFKKKITKLVKKDGARTFLFTGEGNFDLLCWVIITKLKGSYPDIKRVFAQTKDEDNDDDRKLVALMYEHTFLLDSVRDAQEMAETVRNEAMVGMCDMLVTYFNTKELQQTVRIRSYAELAMECARENKKRVINLF